MSTPWWKQSDSEWYRSHLRPEYQKEYDEQQKKKEEERRKKEESEKKEESPKYTVSGTSKEGKLERRTGLSREEARRLSQEQLQRGYRSTSYEREGAVPESRARKFAEESAQSAQERKHRRVKSIAHLFFGGKKEHQAITKARPSSPSRHHQSKKAASALLKFFDEATKPKKRGTGKRYRLRRSRRSRKMRRHRKRRYRGPRRLWR